MKITLAFSEKLKQWRRRKKQSQRVAAYSLGVNLHTFRGWEQGRHEPHERLREFFLKGVLK